MTKSISGKKPRKKTERSQPQPVLQKKQRNRIADWLIKAFGIKSMIMAAAGCLLLYVVISENKGYQWMWTNLLKANWNIIRQHRNATLDERYQMKLGFDYVFWNYVKQNTPEDAVILFPLKEYNTEKADNRQLTYKTNNKMWVTHFIYPRRMLYKDEQDTNPLYKEVTHVAIIAGHGYEDLEYPAGNRTYFTVLPKKQGDNNLTNK
ncbi:MAG: hypothetical protein LBR10_05765 [Prevotellaceae bacterium]|jgi:hypothetical protein|nr:hypothetical protein [Prevotellaceae bacterium]